MKQAAIIGTLLAKRITIALYDALTLLVMAALLLPATATPAYAYIDPSVMTYTIQAVAGVAVALSAVAGVAMRRGRKVLYRILDIDIYAGKTFEPDVHRITADTEAGSQSAEPAAAAHPADPLGEASNQAQASAAEPSGRRKRVFKPHNPPWKERLVFGLIASFFLVYTIYFVAPLEIVAGAAADLVYSIGDAWWVLTGPCLGIVAAITLVLTLLRGRAFAIGLALVFGLGLAAYVQALLLNVDLPAADGATIVWANYMPMQIISTIVWLAILIGAVAYCIIHSKRMQGITAIVSLFLVIVQTVGLVSLAAQPTASKAFITEDELYTVNPNHNVIVFVLDTYDTAYLTHALVDDPHLLDGLTGFTNYENATSAAIPTRFAIPAMLTGQMPRFDEPYSVYKEQRYARSSFLQNIYDANYSLGLYTDSLHISWLPSEEQRSITNKTVNIHDLPDSMMNFGGTLYSLFQMGQYRDAPWPLKWAFWYYTDQINQRMVVYDETAPDDETIYVIDDIRYYNRLCSKGLSIEEDGYDGAFRFIHLLGSHYPFNYDENVDYLGEDESNVIKQSRGAIHIVEEYINQLKELGVYENTTIIVTADHGYWTITLEPIKDTSTPIMFVKPEQSAEADARQIVVDEKPVSHLDLQATVLDAMGLDYSEYSSRDEWAGYSMLGSIDPNRKRYYLTTDSEPDLTETQFREYLIDGNSLDWKSWSETGRTINAQE